MPCTKDIQAFIDSQLEVWPQAAENYAALSGVEVKDVPMPGLACKVQFNPARAVSSGAKVDAAAIKARKCFLCEANRPAVQQGLEWGGHYTILVNPFPIFPRHLTIPDTCHCDQRIAGRVADMLRLAADLEGYTVFYNGPRCGASAPDHMHFQAGNSDFLTIWEALDKAAMETITDDADGRLALADGLPAPVFVIDAAGAEGAERLFDRLYRALPQAADGTEPMMNVLCRAEGGKARIAVIPRKQHRPSFYGNEGDDCMMLSPASVDMGGVFITPRRQDFERLDAEILGRTFSELCLTYGQAKAIASKILSK